MKGHTYFQETDDNNVEPGYPGNNNGVMQLRMIAAREVASHKSGRTLFSRLDLFPVPVLRYPSENLQSLGFISA